AELNLVDNAEPPAETLFSEHDDSPYAAQARLALTRLYMDSGRDQDAADVLRPLAEMPPTDELALVGRFRMTQILLYQEKPQEVVDLVAGLPESAFSARFSEALGDAYAMLGRYSEAEAAYMAASNDDPLAPTVDVTILQLKINDLPSADQVAAEAAETAAAEDDAVEGSADEAAAGADTPADDASEPESE
ncbi:MAG: tetratricopeptide repeat protein, partial [Woeseiaceae bacterium]|nr:tetratricopeptide repeat protein [Woeseiaceae bacterium]